MKILNFGSCNIDYVYSLDHIVRIGETQKGDRLEIFPGGKGLNQSIAASRAGAEVFHAGCIGKDGEFLQEILETSGVDTRFLQKVKEKNGHAIIQVSRKGENSIFLYAGSNEMLTEEYIDSVLEHFEKEDMVLLQNETNKVDYIVEKAYRKGMRVIFNPSPFNGEIGKIDFHKISYLILNEVEGKEISGESEPKEILGYFSERYPELSVMLTLGEKGSIYRNKEVEVYQEIFNVRVQDTTAAGDTFTGYFIAGLSKGEEMGEILKKASAASAIAVSRKGAAPSIPVEDEVRESLKRFSEKGVLV